MRFDYIEKRKAMTAKGVFQWPHLISPDTRYAGDNIPDYTVSVVFDPDAAGVQDFLDQLRSFDDEGYAAALRETSKKKLPRRKCIHEQLDSEQEPTGNLFVKTKTKSAFKDRRTGALIERQVSLFNAEGANVTGSSNYSQIWSGTTGKVKITMDYNKAPNGYGVTCYIDAVQIIDLRSGGGKDASDFGFEAEAGTCTPPEFEAIPDTIQSGDDDQIPF